MEEGSNKGWVWGLVAVVVVVLGGWWLLKSPSSVSGNTIKIGFIGPLTGDAAAYGESDRNGMAIAVDEINKAGGIGGKQIEALYEDGKCNGQDAVSAVQKLVNTDGVKYIVGGGCSSETLALVPVAAQAQAFVISPSASAPKLAGISPYFVRNNPNDNLTGTALADWVAKSYKKVAVVSEKTDYAQGLKQVFVGQAQKDGLNVVAAEDFDTNTTDFRTILTKIKSLSPDALFINPQAGANVGRIAKQARNLGIKAQIVDALFTGPDVLDAGSAVEGMVAVVSPGLATDGKGAQFMAAYKTAYNAEPNYAFYAGAGYDDIYLIKQAIESVGDNGTKVAQYMYSLPSYTGVIGTYHFDQGGDLVGIDEIFQKIMGGKAVNI